MSTPLIAGQIVQLHVSDPWEFGSECGVGPFTARVVDVREASLLLSLEPPIPFRSAQLRSVLVRPRHVGATVDAINSSAGLAANCAFFPGQFGSHSEIGDAAKKGMVPVIGSVRRAR
jgi:hypothetical protein